MLVNFLNNSTMFTFVICFSFGDLYGLFCDVKVNTKMIYFQVSRNFVHWSKRIAPHEKFVDRKLVENAYD